MFMKLGSAKLSTWQLVLLSTGGMIGSGWLFSPYYGFQMTGVWVLLAWFIGMSLTALIGLSFAILKIRKLLEYNTSIC